MVTGYSSNRLKQIMTDIPTPGKGKIRIHESEISMPGPQKDVLLEGHSER